MTDVGASIQLIRETLRAQTALAGVAVEPVVLENVPGGISIRYVTGTDQETNGADRVISSLVFQVVLSVPNNNPLTEAIVAQGKAIDALQGAKGSNTDGTVYLIRRQQPIYYAQRDPNGQVWQYIGGQYEVLVRGG